MISQDTLKPREIEILRLMADGLTNREISEQLYIGVETVRWYAKQIYSKLDVGGREEAAIKAQELALLDATENDQKSQRIVRHNLPVQMTAFVGREYELDTVTQLLNDPNNRLITILAPGGMGKTRVAIETTTRLLAQSDTIPFPNGIFFVPLQPLSEPEQIIAQIATSVDFQFTPDQRDPKQQLFAFLAQKQMLLLIDNWEHLMVGAPLVTELLKACLKLKILATSREKLNLSGEVVYVLSGMQFPEWETPEDALEYDAVKLLTLSAQRVKPDWDVTQQNLDYVARVCRLTQGMPLGIVLAASWVDVLPLDRIATEIQKNVDFLETEMRDVPERQRSVRAVFDWTWERLGETEQQVFMKLSVFRGGFTVDAAEKVAGATMRNLQSLINKALLGRDNFGRYDVHELLRQYGEAELVQSPEVDSQTRDDHAMFFAHIIGEYHQKYYGSDPLPAFQEGRDEFDNILIAWGWALYNDDEHTLLQMINGFSLLFYNLCHFKEGSENFRKVIDKIDNMADTQGYEALYAACSAHCAYQMSYHASDAQTQKMVDKALAFFDHYDMTDASNSILGSYLMFGHALRLLQPRQAFVTFSKVIALTRETDSLVILWLALWQSAFIQVFVFDETDDAVENLGEALLICQQINSYMGITLCESMFGVVLFQKEDYSAAKPKIIEGVRRLKSSDEYYSLAYVYAFLIRIHLKQNNMIEVQQTIREALPLLTIVGLTRNTQGLIHAIAEWHYLSDDPQRALEIVIFAFDDVPFTAYAATTQALNELVAQLESILPSDDFEQAVARGQSLTWEILIKGLQQEFRMDST